MLSLQQMPGSALGIIPYSMNDNTNQTIVVVRHPFRVWKSKLADLLGYSDTYKMKKEFIEPVIYPILNWTDAIYNEKRILSREHTRNLFTTLIERGDITQDAINEWAKKYSSIKLYASTTVKKPSLIPE